MSMQGIINESRVKHCGEITIIIFDIYFSKFLVHILWIFIGSKKNIAFLINEYKYRIY